MSSVFPTHLRLLIRCGNRTQGRAGHAHARMCPSWMQKHAGRHGGCAHVKRSVVGRVDALEAAQQLRDGRQPGIQLRELRLPPLPVAPPLRRVAHAAVRKLLLDLRPAPRASISHVRPRTA